MSMGERKRIRKWVMRKRMPLTANMWQMMTTTRTIRKKRTLRMRMTMQKRIMCKI